MSRLIGRAACAIVVVMAMSLSSAAFADTWNNGSGLAEELDYVNLQYPPTITVAAGQATPDIYGRVYEAGYTEANGASGAITAQIGYGAYGSDPRTTTWQWFSSTYNVQAGNDDEYMASLTVASFGTYSYTYRYSRNGGASWTAADLDGAGSNAGLSFNPSGSNLGTLTVTPEPSAALAALTMAVAGMIRRRHSA
ncbi:MAG TPA: hypothetical protein VF669_14200 [Tepidisphaeraceae bacterium]|jgi:hypothetical protein